MAKPSERRSLRASGLLRKSSPALRSALRPAGLWSTSTIARSSSAVFRCVELLGVEFFVVGELELGVALGALVELLELLGGPLRILCRRRRASSRCAGPRRPGSRCPCWRHHRLQLGRVVVDLHLLDVPGVELEQVLLDPIFEVGRELRRDRSRRRRRRRGSPRGRNADRWRRPSLRGR